MIIPKHNYTEREKTVIDILQDNSTLNIKTFLNIGFHDWDDKRRHWWINLCKQNNIEWNIMEIFQQNIDDSIEKGCPPDNIFNGNILNVDNYNNYDCVLFWHGPEHIEKEVFKTNLELIESKANKIIIFGMPLGYEPQGDSYSNPYECHVSEWNEKDWVELGYTVIPIHDKRKYPHITVYKILNN